LFSIGEIAAARSIRNTLASIQTQSQFGLVKEVGEKGQKISNFVDLFLISADVVGNIRELVIGGFFLGSYLSKGSVDFWNRLVKFKNKSFDKFGSRQQGIAKDIYDRFLEQFILPGIGKPIHQVRNVRNLGDDLFEIKHRSGVRVYIDKEGRRLGYSMKNDQSQVIKKLKSFLDELKNE